MFKFAIILGCALLATSTIAAVVDKFDATEVIGQIDTAIEEIRVKTRDVRYAVLKIGEDSNNSAHAYIESLKVSMNATLQLIQSTIARWEKHGGEAFMKNDCGSYLANLMEVAPSVHEAMDGCALVSTISSAFKLSIGFNNAAIAIEELSKIKALIGTCKAGKCQGAEAEEVIENPTEFRNTIVNHVRDFVRVTCAAIQSVQDSYQQSVEDTDAIFDCVTRITDYRPFVKATSSVLLQTVMCTAMAVQDGPEVATV